MFQFAHVQPTLAAQVTTREDTETRHPGSPPLAEGELGSRLRREQVHAALFGAGKAGAPARVDRFALLEPIGAGGMGELYAAYDAQLDRKIALKLVRTGRGGEKADARLLREAQALAKLAHPNIVTVYEVGSADDRVFVAMEYVHGQTLSAWLEGASAQPEPQRIQALLGLFRDAGRGLAAVHQAGLAHRDFKPDNVLVGSDGRVRIVDFGLARSTLETSDERPASDSQVDVLAARSSISARLASSSGGEASDELVTPDISSLTATGTLLGTPRYMAPEQWRARRGDSRSDQFSFCVALFRALFGAFPFESATSAGLRVAVVGGELREPARKPEVPARLHAALLRGLATDPDARWPDMGELLQAIDEALAPRRGARSSLWLSLSAVVITAAITIALLIQREPPRSLSLTAMTTQIEREVTAERRRVQVAAQIAALDSSGEASNADAVFAAFVMLPQYAHTSALAQAWLDQAKRARERGEPADELAALGEAQLASPTLDQQRRALVELARALARGHRYTQLGATLASIDEAADVLEDEADDEHTAELLSLHVREAVSRRDLAAALDYLALPEAAPLAAELRPILTQLQQVTLTDHLVETDDVRRTAIVALPSLDLDDDGRSELLLSTRGGSILALRSSPTLAIVRDLELEIPGVEAHAPVFRPLARASGRVGAPNWVVADFADQRALFELRNQAGRVEVERLDVATRGTQWVSGDLFTGPGWSGWEAIGADTNQRRLTGFHRPEGALESFVPTPKLDALGSVVEDVAIADLDADGVDELIAGVGAWWAYDVRVLSPKPGAPGEFEPAARRKLGALRGLISFPAPSGRGHWIAVSLPTTPPSPRVFPASKPAGEPSGVYMLAWPGPGRALELVDSVALPDNCRPSAGDLDGDGRSELFVQLKPSSIAVLYCANQDRGTCNYSALWLDGLVYHALADLDGDHDDELIVSEAETGRVMVLGAGNERMPVVDRQAPARQAPPAELDRALDDLWTRAETLAMIGLFDQAGSAFAELARLASPSEAALARRRSAALAERSGARRRAAELYERAGDSDSLARALVLYEQIHGFAEATRVAERLAEFPDAPDSTHERWRTRAASLRTLAEPTQTLEFRFDAPLDDRWRIARPGLLRREPGGLRIESLGAADPLLMQRTIAWEGERLELELELELESLEWASQLRVELVPVDELGAPRGPAIVEGTIWSWGGGDHYVLDLSSGSALEPGSVGDARPMRGALPPLGQRRFRLRLDLLADAEQTWTTITTTDGEGPRDTALEFERSVPPGSLRPGRYQLRLLSSTEPWVRGVLRLVHLRIRGARDDASAPLASPRERVLLSLANGANERALALLDEFTNADPPEPSLLDPRDAAWLRALALEQLGQWPRAVPFIELAIAQCRDPDAMTRFGQAMRLQPDRIGPTLRRICPPERFLLDTWAVDQNPLFQHKDLVDLHRTLTTQLVDLDRYEPRDLAEAEATMGLLTSRARGWLMQDVASAAESDLRRVIELSERWLDLAELDDEQRRDIRRVGSIAHIELAVVLMTRDQLEAAALELDRALANDLAPEIIADVIAARSVFDPLRSSTLWAQIASAQLGLWRR